MIEPAKIKERIMKIGLETGCSHIASALSCVNVLCDIYNADNDALVIVSKGHGVLAQYVILNEIGRLPDEVLATYYQNGGLSCHSTLMPEYGVYASTGSLGHGLGIALGYALADRTRRVYCILGDGELDCGNTLEALRVMLKLNVNNLLPTVDQNKHQGYSSFDEKTVKLLYAPYYSVKGEGWGDLEDTIESHYAKITPELYETWKKNFPEIEKQRLKNLKEYEEKIAKEKEQSNKETEE